MARLWSRYDFIHTHLTIHQSNRLLASPDSRQILGVTSYNVCPFSCFSKSDPDWLCLATSEPSFQKYSQNQRWNISRQIWPLLVCSVLCRLDLVSLDSKRLWHPPLTHPRVKIRTIMCLILPAKLGMTERKWCIISSSPILLLLIIGAPDPNQHYL